MEKTFRLIYLVLKGLTNRCETNSITPSHNERQIKDPKHRDHNETNSYNTYKGEINLESFVKTKFRNPSSDTILYHQTQNKLSKTGEATQVHILFLKKIPT